MGKRVNSPSCKNIRSKKCVVPTQPPVIYGKNGCKLNANGPWGRTYNPRIDAWCKDPLNCPNPNSVPCQGTKDSMCICGGTPGTTVKPSTTTTATMEPKTTMKPKTTKMKTTTKMTTMKPKTTKTTMKPTVGDCKPKAAFAGFAGYVRWCNDNCKYCGKGKGVEGFCYCG